MFFPPAKAWKQVGVIDPDREYVAFTSRFFMKSPRRVLRFLARSGPIEKQVAAAPGVVGWSLAGNLFKLEFYTLSVWEDAESLRRFARDAEHGAVMAEFKDGLRRKSLFVHYSVRGCDLPLPWKDAVERQKSIDASKH